MLNNPSVLPNRPEVQNCLLGMGLINDSALFSKAENS